MNLPDQQDNMKFINIIPFIVLTSLVTFAGTVYANEISITGNNITIKTKNGKNSDNSKNNEKGNITINEEISVNSSTGRVVIKTPDGEVIDTDNIQQGEEAKNNDNVEIKQNGISIGSVTSNGNEQTNVKRSTRVNNVTIINNNGETTIYRKEKKGDSEKSEEK